MPTVVLRPDSTTSETGWNTSNIHTVIGDNNALNVNLAQAKKLRDDIEGAESLLSAAEAPTNREEVIKTLANNKALLEANLTQRKDILDREIKPFLDTQVAGYYEDTYMDLMGTSIDGYVGLPGYHNSFRSGSEEEEQNDANMLTPLRDYTKDLEEKGRTLLDTNLEIKDSEGNSIIRNSDVFLKPIDESKGLYIFKAANGDVHIYNNKEGNIYPAAYTERYLNTPKVPQAIIDIVNKFSGKKKKATLSITYTDWLALIEKMTKARGKNAKAVKAKITKELKEKGLPLTVQEMETLGGVDLFKPANEVVTKEETFVPRKNRRRGGN